MSNDTKLSLMVFGIWVIGCLSMAVFAYILTEPIGVIIDIQPNNDGGLEGHLDREALRQHIEK